ncbi:hypothetical protein FOVG_07089 [Fusarium oxysporum f. sp. pisi HDV247]|uniref:Uncharacterized protein n=1 Tax=Fusarium oxysporum f. sp. pisi HDV247 TaxID=1080344 RepID=W9PTQ1_FUSOX|nr:hypothetical protein FOVG_07089 [Fusarium oxysporum f. sp. pisi HDV247]
MAQKKLTERVLNEANRFLPQTIHSICKAIEVWDRFSRIDLAYLSDILKSDSKKSPIPSVKVVTMIEDHIDALRDLQRRAEEQRDLCTGLARKLEMQIVMEDNEVTARQQAGSEMTRYWTGIGLVFLPLTAVTGIFSMQAGILPESFYKWWIFIIFWVAITLLVILAVEFRSLRSSISILASDCSCSRASSPLHPISSRLSLLSSATDYPVEFELIPRSPGRTV